MDIDEKDRLSPEAVAMLPSSQSATTTKDSPSTYGRFSESCGDDDETYDDFDMEDDIRDFSIVRPSSELESPGNLSDGQLSLGLTSSISERSDNSRTVLIPPSSSSSNSGRTDNKLAATGSGKTSSSLLNKTNSKQKHDWNKTLCDDNDGGSGDGSRDGCRNTENKPHGNDPSFYDSDNGDDDDECSVNASDGCGGSNQNECGIGIFSPPCFQSCANVKMFVFFMCILQVVATALSTGYLNSVITTIEKRFEIGSLVSGLIAAAYEFGNLVAVVFVSYLGANRHIPKWIGSGVILMGIGSLLFSLPHIIAPKYTVRSGVSQNETGEENICKGHGGHSDADLCISQNSGNWGYVLVLVAAQILIGTGGTPIMTLGVTYVDSHVVKEKAPTYLAFIHASGALGPVLGYALGALLLQYYVDTFTHDVQLTPSSPLWIGAWWGGFIICGICLVTLSLPFLAYPRVLAREKRAILEAKTSSQQKEEEAQAQEAEQYGKSIKEIPGAVLHLLKNPIYSILLPAICCEICIVSGFVVFLPKYLESQFGTSTSMANLFTGGIGIPGAVLGILIGGYLMKRLSLTSKGAIQFVLLLNFLAISGFSFFFFLGCDNLKIAGANFPYFNSTGHKIFEANLTSSCNQNCACSPNHIQPICGINGITYFSPCHAGCTGANHYYLPGKEEKTSNYSGCSCIRGGPIRHSNLEVIISPLATSGACKNHCEKLLPFLILLVGMTFCVAGTQMPLLMVTLRSVSTMERSFALGLQFVCMRLFAYIPSPIFFGQAIDKACLLWSQKCGGNGSCLLYDIVRFRYSYVGIAAGLKVVSLCFFVALWFFIRKRSLDEDETKDLEVAAPLSAEDEQKEEHHGLIIGPMDGHGIGGMGGDIKYLQGDAETGGSPLRPSHLPIPIPTSNKPTRISHSAPVGQGLPDPQGHQRHYSESHGDHDDDDRQEVMVMTPGSSNLQSLPMTTSFNEESVL